MKRIEKLASIGSQSLIGGPLRSDRTRNLPHLEKIIDLLEIKNGFYALESALHVFPLGSQPGVMDIEQWNSGELWRSSYGSVIDGITFFAEDIFGFQFGIGDSGVVHFHPEIASMEHIADDIEGWADAILKNYEELTGYRFAHIWQAAHGGLRAGRRLTFMMPLMLGGKCDMENVGEIDAIEVMCFRGDLYEQTKDLPDGAQIEIKIVD